VNRRSRYGWMVLGGLLCLFGVVALCKWRDSSVARAQSQALTLPPVNDPKCDTPPSSMPPVGAQVVDPPAPKPSGEIVQASGTAAPPSVTPLGSAERPITIPASATEPVPAPNAPSPPPPSVTESAPRPAVAPPPGNPSVETGPPSSFTLPPESPPPGSPLPPINADVKANAVTPVKVETPAPKDHPGEPPLAPTPGPVITYRLTAGGETFRSLAKKTLGTHDRWAEIHKLNPTLKADAVLSAGAVVRLPADACVSEDPEAVRQLPSLRPRTAPRPRVALPLTGTFPVTLDDKHGLTLPKSILAQLGNCDTVLLSPGSDKCLWLTNQAHLDRMAAKLDKSPARESDVQGFKRLYYAQTVKVSVKDGHLAISDKLAQFAGLHQELVLVGIDDHFEVWDAARWRHYTQAKKSKTED
jgi:MraZ protein